MDTVYISRFNPEKRKDAEMAIQKIIAKTVVGIHDETTRALAEEILMEVLSEFRPDLVTEECECGWTIEEHRPDCYHNDCDLDDFRIHECYPENGVIIDRDDEGNGSVRLCDKQGEVVYWTFDQFVEDPKVAVSALQFVDMYYREGMGTVRELLGKGIRTSKRTYLY